ncbi:hypothetical protein DFH11DRAFT_1731486 [Phellopilus nigrolimitatus]|nr:hypothetical protein DFH11DRAFT_1731486 [Phellopilus nigrolimitatus]
MKAASSLENLFSCSYSSPAFHHRLSGVDRLHALAVHRCRFVDFTPAAISAITFPLLPLPAAHSSKFKPAGNSKRRFDTLAIGRANGNIEPCEWSDPEHGGQASQAWAVSKILYGPNPSKVDSLVFTLKHPHLHAHNEVPALSDLRLFSASSEPYQPIPYVKSL